MTGFKSDETKEEERLKLRTQREKWYEHPNKKLGNPIRAYFASGNQYIDKNWGVGKLFEPLDKLRPETKWAQEYKNTSTSNKLLNSLKNIIDDYENNKFDVDVNELEKTRSAIEKDIQKYEVPTSWATPDINSMLKRLKTFDHDYNYNLKTLKKFSFDQYYDDSLGWMKLLWHFYNDVINKAPYKDK